MFGHSSAPTFSATASGKTTARSSTLASTPGIPSCNCPTVSHPSPGALGPDMSPDEAAGMSGWGRDLQKVHAIWHLIEHDVPVLGIGRQRRVKYRLVGG